MNFFLKIGFAVWFASTAALAQTPSNLVQPNTAKPNAARPWTYWWWMGSAVNPADLTRQLEQFARAGMGGVHVIPI